MKKVTGAEALKAIAAGDILEQDEIFYKYNDFMKEFLYSHDRELWTSSHLTINEIANSDWNHIEVECLFCGNRKEREIEEMYDPDEIDDGTLYICKEGKGCSE